MSQWKLNSPDLFGVKAITTGLSYDARAMSARRHAEKLVDGRARPRIVS
jgi:hypothetical protein